MFRKMFLAAVAMGSSCLCANHSKKELQENQKVSFPITHYWSREGVKVECLSNAVVSLSGKDFDPLEVAKKTEFTDFSISVYKGFFKHGIKMTNPGVCWHLSWPTVNINSDISLSVDDEHDYNFRLINQDNGRECLIYAFKWTKRSIEMKDFQEKFDLIKEDLFGERPLKSLDADSIADGVWFNFEDVEGGLSICGTILMYPIKKYIIGIVVKNPKKNSIELLAEGRKELDLYPSLLKDCELIKSFIVPVVASEDNE